jgi:hypothetical protein
MGNREEIAEMFGTPAGSGWVCVDCLFLLANGETNPEWSEAETAEFLARFAERNPAGSVTLGLGREEHDCRDSNGETEGDRGGECECERNSFSWSPCDTCGSSLGGQRDAVTFWTD